MNEMRLALALTLLVMFALHPDRVRAGDMPTLAIEAKTPLGEIEGRIDHVACDAARQRLYVAALGNDSNGIVDLNTRRLITTVPVSKSRRESVMSLRRTPFMWRAAVTDRCVFFAARIFVRYRGSYWARMRTMCASTRGYSRSRARRLDKCVVRRSCAVRHRNQ